MRVFVTGGTGFLGGRLVGRLLRDGHEVACLARPGSDTTALHAAAAAATGGDRLAVVRGSLDAIEAVADDVRRSDAVVHAAAAMNGGAATLFAGNVVATRRLLAVVRGSAVRRFVLVSSLGVYAAGHLRRHAVLDESCPLDPEPHRRDAYSYSKIVQERVAWEAYRDAKLPLVVVRPGVIYGPGRGTLSARVGLRVGSVMLRMGGRQRVPYTHVDNCAAAVARAVAEPGIEGEAFNVVDDEPPTARAVLNQYRRRVERLRVVPVPHWAIGPASGACEWYHRRSRGQMPAVLTRYKSAAQWGRLSYPNAKAKALLRWAPDVSFDDGMRETCDWSRRQRERSPAGS